MKNEVFHILWALVILAGFCIVIALILGQIENVPFGESLYKTFLLMATVTEYPATTVLGKLFSGVAVILGLGIILYLVVTITRIIIKFDIQKILNLQGFAKKEKQENTSRIKGR